MKIIVSEEEAGERLDIFLAKKTGITRSQIQKHIEKGNVLLNEKIQTSNYKIKKNDLIYLNIPEEKESGLIPENIPIKIFYKDEYVIVVDKPPSMVVYPSPGHTHRTLMNAIAYHAERLANAGAPFRPGIVHRLDKDTSGLIVVALSDEAYYGLIPQFRERLIKRKYLALIWGRLNKDEGEIITMIGRSESDRKKMSIRTKRGKEAITKWKVIENYNNASLIEVYLKTGRTHQIRVHFASIGHPVLGDRIYGKKIEIILKNRVKIFFPRQMLHAGLLGFRHPVTHEYMEFVSPLPEDMQEKINELRNIKL